MYIIIILLIINHHTSMSCSQYEFFGLSLEWTLASQSSINFHIGLCVFYGLMVMVCKWIASSPSYKPPSWLESVRFIHNIGLALVSGWMMVIQIKQMYLNGRFDSFHSAVCVNSSNSGEWCQRYGNGLILCF